MHSLCSMLVLSVVVSLVSSGKGWVFTDINYEHLMRTQGANLAENEVLKLSPHADGDENDVSQLKFSLIYPGTKWCGPGNVASSFEDLGSEWQTDMCCREHDNCPDILSAGETKHNLTNNVFYTRLSCDCDETFRVCLHNATSSVADQIGNIYFNTIGTQCFKEDYPITGCKKRGGWFNNKCLNYTLDTEGEKKVQWFDVPNY